MNGQLVINKTYSLQTCYIVNDVTKANKDFVLRDIDLLNPNSLTFVRLGEVVLNSLDCEQTLASLRQAIKRDGIMEITFYSLSNLRGLITGNVDNQRHHVVTMDFNGLVYRESYIKGALSRAGFKILNTRRDNLFSLDKYGKITLLCQRK